jgi:hypothetical protein
MLDHGGDLLMVNTSILPGEIRDEGFKVTLEVTIGALN